MACRAGTHAGEGSVNIADLRREGGEAELFAVRPGREPDGCDDMPLFKPANYDRGERMVCWCEACWWKAHGRVAA